MEDLMRLLILAFAKNCTRWGALSRRFSQEDNLLEHAKVSNVVADMIDVIEALGQWR